MLTDRAGKSCVAGATQLTGSVWEHKRMSRSSSVIHLPRNTQASNVPNLLGLDKQTQS